MDGQMDGRMDRQTDEHIVLLHRLFEPVACGRMRCAQLQAGQIIAKNQCG